MDVFGLLFVNMNKERHRNLPNNVDALDTYLRCAVNSARSYISFGNKFSLITNNSEYLEQRGHALGIRPPPIIEIDFSREVPSGLGFASAHRKLEVFAAFGKGQFGPRPILVDLDTELVRPLPASLQTAGSIHALDRTSLMVAEFGERLQTTLQTILGEQPTLSRWFGGEFICADAGHYHDIAAIADACWDRYVTQDMHSIIHNGDEALTSAALTTLASNGRCVVDAGAEKLVSRYWSSRTNLPLPPYRQSARAAVLHLPADKEFLAARAGRHPNPRDFNRDYRRAVGSKLASRALLNAVERLVGRKPRRYAPRW